jgi:hypothetical protein
MGQYIEVPALVAKTDPADHASYLRVDSGRIDWVDSPVAATAFTSMREAARMAARLPASQRAYSLPRHIELALHAQ